MERIPSGMPGPQMQEQPVKFELKKPELQDNRVVFKTFGETLKGFVEDVNDLQNQSGKAIEQFLTGEIEDAHDVMIAVEKAGISFEMMMEIRNKMVEAYHEIMRMQV